MPVPGFLAGWSVSPFLRELPVSSRDDVIALLPEYMREGAVPVRDAIADALLVSIIRYASDQAADAARTDPAYADGADLDLIGLGVLARAPSESDASYRARMLTRSGGATPRALLAAIDTILEPFGKAGAAYYVELPDDEIFVYDNLAVLDVTGSIAGSNTQGAYLESADGPTVGAGAIVADERYYEARTRCEPRHTFVFGVYRDPETTRAPGAEASDDFTDAFNQWGHTLIHIPPFDAPENDDPLGAYTALVPTAVNSVLPADLLDTSGNPTAAAILLDELTFDVQTSADLIAAFGAGDDFGAAVFARDLDGAIAVDAIRSMLAVRGSFPDAFTIVLDPELA